MDCSIVYFHNYRAVKSPNIHTLLSFPVSFVIKRLCLGCFWFIYFIPYVDVYSYRLQSWIWNRKKAISSIPIKTLQCFPWRFWTPTKCYVMQLCKWLTWLFKFPVIKISWSWNFHWPVSESKTKDHSVDVMYSPLHNWPSLLVKPHKSKNLLNTRFPLWITLFQQDNEH